MEIASALVKVRSRFPAFEVNPALTSGFMTEKASSIEPRVKRLVLLADKLPSVEANVKLAGKPFFEAAALAVLFVGSLFGILSLAPLIVHQTAESLIEFIK